MIVYQTTNKNVTYNWFSFIRLGGHDFGVIWFYLDLPIL